MTKVKRINAHGLEYDRLNAIIRDTEDDCDVYGCMGQRFIASGRSNGKISISGIPGNALGAYLNGAFIEVNGNAQDAVGDTMNEGTIVIHGNMGDTAGYAMRGGRIFAKGSAGYRAGIHMKAYKDKIPVMVIGGCTGSFLGEYQAGGLIIVLGLNPNGRPIVSNFPGTGMHGGKMFLRSDCKDILFPKQVETHIATDGEKDEIRSHIEDFASLFGYDASFILNGIFTVVTPDSNNPYHQLYVAN